MCFLHGIRLNFGQLHRVADLPLESLDLLTMQRYEIYRALPNFAPRFGPIFSTKSPNFIEPSLELVSLATEGTQEFRALESVIFEPLVLLFVDSGQGEHIIRLPQRHFATLPH